MADSDFYTIHQAVKSEIRVKRSRFMGALLPAETRDAAGKIIAEFREKYHDATHNCFGYRIDENIYRFSDDGEPSGTAGKPILSMLEKYQLVRCVLVVTRYFGGVKLGTGGLIRAYSQCAEETIQKAGLIKFVQYQLIKIHYPYHLTRMIHYLVSKYDALIDDSAFGADISANIRIPRENSGVFEQEVLKIANGQVHIKHTESSCK